MKWLIALFGTVACAGWASAVDPARSLAQYLRDAWTSEQGFAGGAVHALAQTTDGYLWIGAEKGLIRFDGSNFRPYYHVNSPALPAGPVLGLAASSDGYLWIKMQSPGVLRYRNGTFEDASVALPALDRPLTAMFQQKGGDILLASIDRVILRYSGGKLTQQPFVASPLDLLVVSIAGTSDGTMWLGTRENGLLSVSAGATTAVSKGLRDKRINCLLPYGDRELWIGTDAGLLRWDGAKVTGDGVPDSLLHSQVLSLLEDHDSNIWVGTPAGLVRMGSAANASARREGLPITALFEDREGELWMGGPQGIERFRDSAFVSYAPFGVRQTGNNGPIYVDDQQRIWFAPPEGGLFWMRGSKIQRIEAMGRDPVYSITGAAGELWVGRQRGGLTHLVRSGDSFTAKTYTRADGLAQDSVYAVRRSRDGSVWAATVSGGVSQLRNGRFTSYTTSNGLASGSVSAIEEGTDGTMWFATANGLNAFSNDRWRLYTGREGLPSGHIDCLLAGDHGVLWIGGSEGLAFMRSGRVQIPEGAPNSLHEEIYGIAEDGHGWLWIGTAGHVLRVRRDNLLNGGLREGDLREFGPRDGLLSTEGVKRDRSVVADSSGRIWFSMDRGISVVDPAQLMRAPVPAIVHIQGVSADGSLMDVRQSIRVSSRIDRVVFSYVGLSLSAPERVTYRYMLEGADDAWSVPASTNEAGYNKLSPRTYRFRIVASDIDGLWNSQEAVVGLTVDPTFWQTWWFYVAVSWCCGMAIWGLYRYQMRQLRNQLNVRFEERLAERTRIAQELHDTLLQGFLSASMQLNIAVDRLPEDSPIKPPLARVLELMSRVIDEGRKTVQGLRSSYSGTPELGQAFSTITRELAVQADIGFRVIVEGQPCPLHPILRDEVYRIGHEALVNAFRHSRATNIELELEYAARRLHLSVRDNGCGIDAEVLRTGGAGSEGLAGMRERAERIGAELHVWSSAAGGTEIELRVPARVAYRVSSGQPAPRKFRWKPVGEKKG